MTLWRHFGYLAAFFSNMRAHKFYMPSEPKRKSNCICFRHMFMTLIWNQQSPGGAFYETKDDSEQTRLKMNYVNHSEEPVNMFLPWHFLSFSILVV